MLVSLSVSSCSDGDPDVRTENDLVGVWTDTPGHYIFIQNDTRIFSLYVETYEEDGETEEMGVLEQDGYIYEPAYNFIVYMNRESQPNIYQLMSLTDDRMIWCWVDNLRDKKYENLSKTEILGAVLKEADKGFHTDPKDYITFSRVSDAEFQSILDKYEVEIPD